MTNHSLRRCRLESFSRARGSAWLLCALLLLGAAPAAGQIRIPQEARIDNSEIARQLEKGRELEGEGRWAEAMSHYDDALREYPESVELQQRRTFARMHFDVTRRYADPSYRDSTRQLTREQALELYREVLLKVHSHYVDEPNWRGLVDWGTSHARIALADPTFREQQLPANTDPRRVVQFDSLLAAELAKLPVRNRLEAENAAAQAANLAMHYLGISPTAVVLEYICGATAALDPYSSYLTAAQLDDQFSQIEGNFVGLGIEIKADEGALRVVGVISGSPADQAGLRAGDRIVEIDGHDTRRLAGDAAADLLKGPEGSTVELRVLDERESIRQVTARRARVEVPSVDQVQLLDRDFGVGYLRITSFQKTTSRELDAALWKLHGLGMRSLILDLRGNPGGLLTGSVEAADKFIAEGTIVSTRGRSSHEDYDYKAHRVGTWRVPLIVLIDRDSASASEIFAGAIRDSRRGTVVGERSYGKGSVQGIFPLHTTRAGVRITTAKFYSPSGRAISHAGVEPDVVVRRVARPDAAGQVPASPEDAVIAAGLQVARQQLSQR